MFLDVTSVDFCPRGVALCSVWFLVPEFRTDEQREEFPLVGRRTLFVRDFVHKLIGNAFNVVAGRRQSRRMPKRRAKNEGRCKHHSVPPALLGGRGIRCFAVKRLEERRTQVPQFPHSSPPKHTVPDLWNCYSISTHCCDTLLSCLDGRVQQYLVRFIRNIGLEV